MDDFSRDALITIAVTVAILLVVQFRRGVPTDLLFLFGLMVVVFTTGITPDVAVSGFRSTAVIAIGSLFVVSAGLKSTGVLDWVGETLLGSAADEKTAFRRLAVVLVSTSAFVLNTVLVAMFVPIVVDWCRKRQVSPSRLLIPVSYLAILGGVCTLIGTSTTLIVNAELKEARDEAKRQVEEQSESEPKRQEQLESAQRGAQEQEESESDTQRLQRQGPDANPSKQEQKKEVDADFIAGVQPMGLFDLTRIGIPIALMGSAFLYFVGRRLLPDRQDMIEQLDEQRREYLVEMLVNKECRLIGQTIEAAGLRSLPGLFLIEIDRDGRIITPVAPHDVIRSGDRMVFTGLVETIVDLERIPGLVPAADRTYDMHGTQRHMTEVVLSRSSPLIGSTMKEANFRRRYNAAVVAVHRNGERLTNKIGNIHLEPGDTLLLQTRTPFAPRHRNNRDFYLVSPVEGYAPRRYEKARLAAILGIVLIIWLASLNWVAAALNWPAARDFTPIAAITIACLMIATRCVSASDARAALDLQVLLTIVGALGLGKALRVSGAADSLASLLVGSVGENPYVLLIAVYLLAMVFTELITNNAVAAILLPISISVAFTAGLSPRPFVMAIALAASLSFITPIGYQTNLMVMGPGGYQPRDYLRIGLPLSLIVMATAIALLPVIWPFR